MKLLKPLLVLLFIALPFAVAFIVTYRASSNGSQHLLHAGKMKLSYSWAGRTHFREFCGALHLTAPVDKSPKVHTEGPQLLVGDKPLTCPEGKIALIAADGAVQHLAVPEECFELSPLTNEVYFMGIRMPRFRDGDQIRSGLKPRCLARHKLMKTIRTAVMGVR